MTKRRTGTRITHFALGNEDDSGKITHDQETFSVKSAKFPTSNRHPVAEFDLALLEYVLQMLLITGDCEHSVQIIESG